jgi:hypothetical protein
MRKGIIPILATLPTVPGFGAQVFSPASIAGLSLWLRADLISGVSDGGPVASWNDLSGNARNATQGTGSKQPLLIYNQINGKKIVRFDAVDDALVLPALVTTSASVFVVTKATPGSSAAYSPFIITESLRICVKLGSGTDWGTFVGADLSAGETLVFATPALVEMTSTPGATFLYRDGVQKATTSGASTGAATGSIGDETGVSRFLSGDIAEIVVYNSVLSASDRLLVEKYLGQSYGITI